MSSSPPRIQAENGRVFATFPAAVVVPLVDAAGRLLLLGSPRRDDLWEVVNGGVEAGETLLGAALREVAEEAGPAVEVRPLGCIHVETFAYDATVSRMISVVYLMAYQGGTIEPGDDMAGCPARWIDRETLREEGLSILAPLDRPWLVDRVFDTARAWFDEARELQPPVP